MITKTFFNLMHISMILWIYVILHNIIVELHMLVVIVFCLDNYLILCCLHNCNKIFMLDRVRKIYELFPQIPVPHNLEDDDDLHELTEALGAAKLRVEGCSSFLKAAIKWEIIALLYYWTFCFWWMLWFLKHGYNLVFLLIVTNNLVATSIAKFYKNNIVGIIPAMCPEVSPFHTMLPTLWWGNACFNSDFFLFPLSFL